MFKFLFLGGFTPSKTFACVGRSTYQLQQLNKILLVNFLMATFVKLAGSKFLTYYKKHEMKIKIKEKTILRGVQFNAAMFTMTLLTFN